MSNGAALRNLVGIASEISPRIPKHILSVILPRAPPEIPSRIPIKIRLSIPPEIFSRIPSGLSLRVSADISIKLYLEFWLRFVNYFQPGFLQ